MEIIYDEAKKGLWVWPLFILHPDPLVHILQIFLPGLVLAPEKNKNENNSSTLEGASIQRRIVRKS